jgi:hypothetical protein
MTPAWVYNETRAGRIPHLKLRRYVRYHRSRIAEWERENEEGALACAGGSEHLDGARGPVGRRV